MDDTQNMKMSDIQKAASRNEPGFKTINKLLNDNRFNK